MGYESPRTVLYTMVTAAHRAGARRATERTVDQVLADSFPASDPPSWTLGVARVDALYFGRSAEHKGIVDVPRPLGTSGTSLQFLASLAGAVGIALVIPFMFLLAGSAKWTVPFASFRKQSARSEVVREPLTSDDYVRASDKTHPRRSDRNHAETKARL